MKRTENKERVEAFKASNGPVQNWLTCCLCGCEFLGYNGFGNNPWPLRKTGECCNDCKHMWVIPARIELARKEREERNED